MGYTIGFFADTHLGYSSGKDIDPSSGLNLRVVDGYLALQETITAMIDAQCDLVVQGGDLFHSPTPTPADIAFANRELRRLADADIKVVVNTGNHDAPGDRGTGAAVLTVDDPSRGITSVFTPYRELPIEDGLRLHVVSHYGLAQDHRVVPEPTDGDINILTAHGTAQLPGHEIFACVDTLREQPIAFDLLTDTRFSATLLGHYHSQEALPNLPHAWYAGSALRRGFSDKPGQRGWLKVTVESNGLTTVEPQAIHQRPQVDLPPVDADGMDREDIVAAVLANLEAMTIDPAGAIIRQKVTSIAPAQRAALSDDRIKAATADAFQWAAVPQSRTKTFVPVDDPAVDSDDPADEVTTETAGSAASMATAATVDLITGWQRWSKDWLTEQNIPDPRHDWVVEEGTKVLHDVTPHADTDGMSTVADDDSSVTGDATPAPSADDPFADLAPLAPAAVSADDDADDPFPDPSNDDPFADLTPTTPDDRVPF